MKRKPDEPLGHGDHWTALGFDDTEKLQKFIPKWLAAGSLICRFQAPWPKAPFKEVALIERRLGTLNVGILLGRNQPEDQWEILSAHPVMKCAQEWIVRVDEVSNAYGAFEGLIKGEASSGHPLIWFAPYFGWQAQGWRIPGFLQVRLSALALWIEPAEAKPFAVTEGPLIEELREELRREGKFEEAKSKNLKIDVETSQMRTLYSKFHDHHSFIGKVLSKRAIRPIPEFECLILDVEVMPDPVSTGYRIPLYVSKSVLGKYKPQRGDLVQGSAWLQGEWGRVARGPEKTAWRKQK